MNIFLLVEVQGIKCKHTTNKLLAITLLGTDKTPVISNKDPISRLIISKAHVRDIHVSTNPIHSTDSTTLSKNNDRSLWGFNDEC